MAEGIFATPNIGNAGAEVAQVQPDAPNYAGIPGTAEILSNAAKPIVEGTYGVAGYVESRGIKSQAEQLSTQLQDGFKQDAASQSAAQSLGQMKQAVSQGQLSSSSMLLRAKALQDKAKGLSPVYAAEIDEVFAKNGVDPNGRNGLGVGKADFAVEDMKDKIKTVSTWHRDPNMSQYVVYTPGMDHTEDNIDVKSTLDNVAKVNDTLRSTEQGLSSTVSTTLSTIDSQMSNQLSRLQQAKGDPAQIAAQQQAVVSQFKNQINQLIAFSVQQQGNFPPGSDQYKNVSSQITAIRAFKNDLETMTPQQLLAAKTNADMIGANLSSVTGKYQISYYESGLKALDDLSKINANGLNVFDTSKLTLLQEKINSGQSLDPVHEQPLYDLAKSPASFIRFLQTNGQKTSYNQMDAAAPQVLAQSDGQSLSAFINGAYNKFTDKNQQEDTKQKLAFNSARLLDGVANTGMFIKNPSNFMSILKDTSNNIQINALLNALPTAQRDVTAQNIITSSRMAMTASGLPFSIPTLKGASAKVTIDERTGTINFQSFGRLKDSNALGMAGDIELNALGQGANTNTMMANQVWNNALQSMVNVSSYDSNLNGKSKGQIALDLLKQYGYPEDLIEIRN